MIQALAAHRAHGAEHGMDPPEHFWRLVGRFRADLVNQAFALLGRQADAEDVAQESLCEFFHDLASLRDPRRLGAWLRRINRRDALDLLRRRRREEDKMARARRAPDRTEAVSGGFSRIEIRELVARAIDTLPAELRHVVVPRYWEHRSQAELAASLGLPIGTIKSRLIGGPTRPARGV